MGNSVCYYLKKAENATFVISNWFLAPFFFCSLAMGKSKTLRVDTSTGGKTGTTAGLSTQSGGEPWPWYLGGPLLHPARRAGVTMIVLFGTGIIAWMLYTRPPPVPWYKNPENIARGVAAALAALLTFLLCATMFLNGEEISTSLPKPRPRPKKGRRSFSAHPPSTALGPASHVEARMRKPTRQPSPPKRSKKVAKRPKSPEARKGKPAPRRRPSTPRKARKTGLKAARRQRKTRRKKKPPSPPPPPPEAISETAEVPKPPGKRKKARRKRKRNKKKRKAASSPAKKSPCSSVHPRRKRTKNKQRQAAAEVDQGKKNPKDPDLKELTKKHFMDVPFYWQ